MTAAHVIPRRPVTPIPAASVRCWLAGLADLENALAHLVLAARATVGADAPDYVRERIACWLNEYSDDTMDDLADALIETAEQLMLKKGSR